MQSECMPWRTLARVQVCPSSALVMTPWPMVPTRMLPFAAMVHLLDLRTVSLRRALLVPWSGLYPRPRAVGIGLEYGRLRVTGRDAMTTHDQPLTPPSPGRRAFVRGAAGLAGILAAGRPPAAFA